MVVTCLPDYGAYLALFCQHDKPRLMLKSIVGSLLLACLLVQSCSGGPGKASTVDTELQDTLGSFDSLKAARYGADPYGMKTYVMAFLKRGANQSVDSARAAQLQRAHLQNIERMATAGDLLLAGPFLDGGELRGIYVFNVRTVEQARALTETDPAIQAGTLAMELKPWYGSAALLEVNDIHRTLAREAITE